MIKKLKEMKLSSWVLIISAFYFSGTIIQNILAAKMFGTETYTICDGGLFISWLVFACMDIVTEIFGKKTSIKYFTIASVLNVLFTLIFLLVIAIPGNDPVTSGAFSTVLGTTWRIVLASITAFWLGNYVNTFIMHLFKVKSKNPDSNKSFIFRAVVSTALGQFVDNFLFYVIAFAPLGIVGTIEISWVGILTGSLLGTLFETILEAIFSPFTAKFVNHLRSKKKRRTK